MLRRVNFGAGGQFGTDVANRYGEGSEMLVSCPSFSWSFGFPWFILSKELLGKLMFSLLFQGFCGFRKERDPWLCSLVNRSTKRKEGQGFSRQKRQKNGTDSENLRR